MFGFPNITITTFNCALPANAIYFLPRRALRAGFSLRSHPKLYSSRIRFGCRSVDAKRSGTENRKKTLCCPMVSPTVGAGTPGCDSQILSWNCIILRKCLAQNIPRKFWAINRRFLRGEDPNRDLPPRIGLAIISGGRYGGGEVAIRNSADPLRVQSAY